MPIVGAVLADRYRIEAVLGVGGMASVYRATDLRLDRQVAVKVLLANLSADAQFAERFSREAGAMAGFSHPNIVAVYDVEPGDQTTGREPFYVMEYCQGGSLADRLKVSGRMPPDELIPIVAAVSEGLAELHRHGLIHRDVKPANILFASDRPKLADFGVAWSEGPPDGDALTLPGSTPGTVAYLAPELTAGAPPSSASDVYALGVTIFRALTGRYPRPSTDAGAIVGARLGVLESVSAAAPHLGPSFDAALARALDPDPAARPSPAGLAADVAAALEIGGVAAPAAPPSAPSDVDPEAPTLVASELTSMAPRASAVPQGPIPQQPAAQQPAAWQPAPSPSDRFGRGGVAIFVVVLVVLTALAVLLLPRLMSGKPGLPGASATATPSAAATASAKATASPKATTLPTSNAAILAALSRVDAAIEAARGGKHGLNVNAANTLMQLASAVRSAVNLGDLGAAATAAQALSNQGGSLTKELDKSRRDALLAAIDDLLAALPPP